MADRQHDTPTPEPIAIVGIGCRFPGGADSPQRFWELLSSGIDAIGDFPAGRFDIDEFYHPTPATPGKIVTRQGGFLADVDRFDAEFFSISPREAMSIDPQQRLLLETAWEAFEDAGIPVGGPSGHNTGVFVGLWTSDYEAMTFGQHDDVDLYVTTGGGRYAASGRLSYALDLRGPSLTIDTACSSSLVAVHLACRSLRERECDAALAGGVNLILQPQISIGYSRSRMLSPDGRCKFGDAEANGYVRSEGCGVVVLKRLSDAIDAGDDIYAVILGSATNNDGQGSGLLVQPAVAGQVAMLRDAYGQAGVDPASVQYVEAHGTGTRAGDPVELEALGTVLGTGRSPGQPFSVGSVKTNIGHTEAASGVAGLIKVALALRHRALPASLHFSMPNPLVPWDRLPLRIQDAYGAWSESTGPLTAAVNSFGITGTNAHVILQEWPRDVRDTPAGADDRAAQLVSLSAGNPDVLVAAARLLSNRIEADAPALADLAHTLGRRRTHLSERLAIVATNLDELAAGLDAFVSGDESPNLRRGRAAKTEPSVVFVFPGQGSQWDGMARELIESEPAFRDALAEIDAAIHAEAGWSVIEQLTAPAGTNRLSDIDVIQPVLFAIQVALAALWRSWGIRPAAVIGHSMGEVAAAHVAGALSLADAVAVICRRSLLLRRIRGRGAMAMVDLSVDDARARLRGFEDVLSIGVSNGPRSTVLSGDSAALETVMERLSQENVFCRPVKVDVASHSPQVDPLLDDLRSALNALTPQEADVPIYSTVTTEPIPGTSLTADYWSKNLRQPVMFGATVERLLADDMLAFIEVSPHPILVPAIQQAMVEWEADGIVVPSMRRGEPEREAILGALGALFTRGVAPDWRAVVSPGRHLHLPTYPWQRERFWYDDGLASGAQPAKRYGGHPLLGHAFTAAGQSGVHNWELALDLRSHPYLSDHRVGDAILVPATMIAELMLTAAAEVIGTTALSLNEVALNDAIVVPADGTKMVQVSLVQRAGIVQARVFSATDTDDGQPTWSLAAEATVTPGSVEHLPPADAPADVRSRCRQAQPGELHYGAMASRSLAYGPAFQSVETLWRGDRDLLALMRLPGTAGLPVHAERLTLLDGALQVAVAAIPERVAGTFVPVEIGTLTIRCDLEPGQQLWAHVAAQGIGEDGAGAFTTDIQLLDGDGTLIAEVLRLKLAPIGRAGHGDVSAMLQTIQWVDVPRSELAAQADRKWLIIAPPPAGDDIAAELERRGGRCVVIRPDVLASSTTATGVGTPASSIDLATLVRNDFGSTVPTDIVYLNATAQPGDLQAGTASAWGAVALMRAVASIGWAEMPRLWLVTRSAQPVGDGVVDPAQALIWGIGRVAANEMPELRPTLVDLNGDLDLAALCDELAVPSEARQVALRASGRYEARLEPSSAIAGTLAVTSRRADTGEPYRVEVGQPGILDSLGARPSARHIPQPGEVEIRVTAAGINFIDVMKAMGIYPGVERSPLIGLGAECAGTVVAVGEDVTSLAVGDEVVALTSSFVDTSCLATYVTLPAELVAHRPSRMSENEIAGLPVVYMTAYYALHELGRMRAGDCVLIHSAAGGVGLAAINIARRAGAQIFATAGSPEKREYLQQMGIEHVYDSRNLSFVDAVLADTGGRGVNIVLNSLAGEAVEANLRVLAPRGRFIEIGKRDIYADTSIGLAPFRRNLGFFALDLARMVEEDRADVAEIFQTVVGLLADGELPSLPVTVYPASQVAEAFREMAQARHIGKLVVRLADEPVEIVTGGLTIRPDGAYLITGGVGALGLETARWLARHGAKHLALMGRGTPSEPAMEAIRSLEDAGVNVRLVRGDVASEADVARVLDEIAQHLPALRGVFHLAGLLADATIQQLEHDRLLECLAPKMLGSWNLHQQTAGLPLDLFVLFSSVASILGLPGQANYAAANAFLDALAHHRRATGLPALSVNWAPWADVGLAAADANRGQRLEAQGLDSLSASSALAALEHLLGQGATQAGVLSLDLERWGQSNPSASTPFYTALRQSAGGESAAPGLREMVLAVVPDRRIPLLESFVREQLVQILRLAPDRLPARTPLKTLGLDSLMALELRNRLEAGSGITLSATLAWNYPTIEALAEHLAARLQIIIDEPVATAPHDQLPTDAENLDGLSDDELSSLLEDELDAIAAVLGN